MADQDGCQHYENESSFLSKYFNQRLSSLITTQHSACLQMYPVDLMESAQWHHSECQAQSWGSLLTWLISCQSHVSSAIRVVFTCEGKQCFLQIENNVHILHPWVSIWNIPHLVQNCMLPSHVLSQKVKWKLGRIPIPHWGGKGQFHSSFNFSSHQQPCLFEYAVEGGPTKTEHKRREKV